MFKHAMILLTVLAIGLTDPSCTIGKNHCTKCNPLTNLCIKCEKEIFKPDENGGCTGASKCTMGQNYCLKCDEDNKICAECEIGYYPDENGACTYTGNCKYSYKGECLECSEDFILIGGRNSLQICKSTESDDLKNCLNIAKSSGLCEKCEEGYFLNDVDKKCTKTGNCSESSFGVCKKCKTGFYLNKKEDKCIQKNDTFLFCKETVDGEKCDECEEGYFFSEDEKCTAAENCQKSVNGICKKCSEDYYMTENKLCVSEKNCQWADKDTGLCNSCLKGFYLDNKDRKCKSNLEDDDFKYCNVSSKVCLQCKYGYYLSADNKCSLSKNCSEVENGECTKCDKGLNLGEDKKCSNVKDCIKTNSAGECIECKDEKHVFNKKTQKCEEESGSLVNCLVTKNDGYVCDICRDGFYFNQEDYYCHTNTEKGKFYKCKKTNSVANLCLECEKGFYLGVGDFRCSPVDHCYKSENGTTCNECTETYCLDLKKGTCESNNRIEDEEVKIYYNCIKTNEKGTKCAKCVNGTKVGDDGWCVNLEDCEDEDDGVCQECKEKNKLGQNLCANPDFGCVYTKDENCLKCGDSSNVNVCTECKDGFELDDNNICFKS